MVRIAVDKIDLEHVDFSFIPSLECNLRCSFCMYCAGPDIKLMLDLHIAQEFVRKVDWSVIGSWGFYGGEPSINLPLYDDFMGLIPSEIPKFLITNGSWTRKEEDLDAFFHFIKQRVDKCGDNLRVFVSGTEEHKRFQNASTIDAFRGNIGFTVKGDEEIHPMGRAYKERWTCTEKCTWHPQPIRLAMFPTGHIVLQNCDGVYPIVGHWDEDFAEVLRIAKYMRSTGCHPATRYNINEFLVSLDLL